MLIIGEIRDAENWYHTLGSMFWHCVLGWTIKECKSAFCENVCKLNTQLVFKKVIKYYYPKFNTVMYYEIWVLIGI